MKYISIKCLIIIIVKAACCYMIESKIALLVSSISVNH